MQNQINRRQQNQSALVIEEITARQEQSEKASKQDSILIVNHSLTQKQLSWSQNSNDPKTYDPLDKSKIISNEQMVHRQQTVKNNHMRQKKQINSRSIRSNELTNMIQNRKDIHIGYGQETDGANMEANNGDFEYGNGTF